MKNTEQQSFDVVVIGAGVSGCMTARELSRFELDVMVLEAGTDIATGQTRANSGIVHAGHDPEPGTLKARFNVEGSKIYPQLAADLNVPFVTNGSLVVATTPQEEQAAHDLVERAALNGVEGVVYLDTDELHKREPALSPDAIGALWAPTGGIVDPYNIAFAALENAVENGVRVAFGKRVDSVSQPDDRGCRRVVCTDGTSYESRCVVNAAGVHADELNNMVSADKLHITPRRGEYYLLSTDYGSVFSATVFQAPSEAGKGVLVSPTVHGNLIVGPNAIEQSVKDATATDPSTIEAVLEKARKTWPDASKRGVITTFAGVRSTGDSRDFVLGEPDDAPGFFNIACFDSPGLTSAPAVGRFIAEGVASRLGAQRDESFVATRKAAKPFHLMDADERKAAIAENPAYGHVVCRCCEVTEAEVCAVLHGPVPVGELDAIKWRCGATMGECHGGFCTPELARIVARETGVAPDVLCKHGAGSPLVEAAQDDYVDKVRSASSAVACPGEADDVLYDVAVVGGGAGGLAAATAAAEAGSRVILLDQEDRPGGILKQCIHNGFGLHRFGEELTGPEYAEREKKALDAKANVTVVDRATVSSIESAGEGADRVFTLRIAAERGCEAVRASAVVLATGSRERSVGEIAIPGSRPSGVFSAGSAQNFMNLQGCVPGKRVVILGSGDIGLIMARRLTCEGATVEGVYEVLPEPSGLRRNIVQCLDDYAIPLHTSTTVTQIHGSARIEGVTVACVDEHRAPIAGTERFIECDTLLLSVGLIPQNPLARNLGIEIDSATGGAAVDSQLETSLAGIYACGNALHIHDLVDFVSQEGTMAGKAAARHARELRDRADGPQLEEHGKVPTVAGDGVSYVIPHRVRKGQSRVVVSFRVTQRMEKPRIVIEGVLPDGTRESLARKREKAAAPAEMETIVIDASDINLMDSLDHIEVRMEA